MTVYTSLIGGLGNQMFQYAAGRALALRRGDQLRLVLSAYDANEMHQGFELQQVFSCKTEIAREADIKRLLGWQSPSIFRRLLARPDLAAIRREAYVVEPHFHYWPNINKAPQDCYLAGYWQSEQYFKDVEKIIRADLTFRTPMSDQNEQIASLIAQGSAVSLHVRRGDYVSNPKTNATHGICSLEYYQAAINYLVDKIANPQFFIFSDDMQWVKENFKLEFPCFYIEHNTGNESYNDMRLMSLCQLHIIANSSFSWWGAWLNANPERIVVAPKKWFAKNNNTQDLYPDGWKKL